MLLGGPISEQVWPGCHFQPLFTGRVDAQSTTPLSPEAPGRKRGNPEGKQAPTLDSREGGDDLKHNHKHKRQVLSPRPLGCARVVRWTRVETCSRERRERGKSKKTRPRQKIESKRARGGETKWCCCSLRGPSDKPTVDARGRERERHLFRGTKKKRCPVKVGMGWIGWMTRRAAVRLAGASKAGGCGSVGPLGLQLRPGTN